MLLCTAVIVPRPVCLFLGRVGNVAQHSLVAHVVDEETGPVLKARVERANRTTLEQKGLLHMSQ